MKYAVQIRLSARFDIAEAEDWYEERSPGLGARFRDSVSFAIDRICRNPLAYQEVIAGIRRHVMPGFPYNIWFRVSGADILLVAVIHGKRGPRIIRTKLRGL